MKLYIKLEFLDTSLRMYLYHIFELLGLVYGNTYCLTFYRLTLVFHIRSRIFSWKILIKIIQCYSGPRFWCPSSNKKYESSFTGRSPLWWCGMFKSQRGQISTFIKCSSANVEKCSTLKMSFHDLVYRIV